MSDTASKLKALENPPPHLEWDQRREIRSFASSSALLLFGTLVAQALGALVTLWIARTLGPDLYGLLSLALAVTTLVIPFATIGLTNTVVRFIPVYIGRHEDSEVRGTLYSSGLLTGAVSLGCAFLIFALAPLLAEHVYNEMRLAPVLRLLALTIPMSAISNIAVALTRGLKIMYFDAIIKVLVPLSRLVTWALALYLWVEFLESAILSYVASAIVSVFAGLLFVLVAFKPFLLGKVQWSFSPLLKYSLPLVLSALMYSVAPKIDRLLLGALADSHAVGVYSVAATLSAYVLLIRKSIVTTFMPTVADLYNRTSTNQAKKLYIKVTSWDAQLTFISVVFMLIFSKELILLLGNDYAMAVLPLMILVVAAYCSSLPGPTGGFLMVTDRQNIEAVNALLTLVISVVCQLILGWWLGMIGIALGVLAAVVFLNFIQVAEIWWFYGFQPFQEGHAGFSLISLASLGVVVYVVLQTSFWGRLFVLGFILAGFFSFIYLFRRSDIRLLINAFRLRGKAYT